MHHSTQEGPVIKHKTGLIRRGLVMAALIAGTIALTATSASAIPTFPNQYPDKLAVLTWYDAPVNGNEVGQSWHGCGQPAGSWGTQSGWAVLSTPLC